MEFTKNEQRILSAKHEAFQKVLLGTGIFMIIFSIAIVFLQINNINKAEKKWIEAYSYINQNINPVTKQAIFLKSMLLDNINRTKDMYLGHQKEKMALDLILFFFVGCYCMITYYTNRRYIKLIRKLQNS